MRGPAIKSNHPVASPLVGHEKGTGSAPKLIMRAILGCAFTLQCLHIASCLTGFKLLVLSNAVQVVLPWLALAGCCVQRSCAPDHVSRRIWSALGLAFAIWSVAEACYLVELYLLPRRSIYSNTDDYLWILFAVPLLLVLSGCLQGRMDGLSKLDQLQTMLGFFVIAALVYSKPAALSFNQAYDCQNLALFLSCCVRLSTAPSESERRFFRNLWIYLLVYTTCAAVGNELLSAEGKQAAWIDLFWTVPITTFCVALFWRIGYPVASSGQHEERRESKWGRHIQDLGALLITSLTMAASAYLVLSHQLLGYACLAASFFLLAARTCGRSMQLHKANDSLRESNVTDLLTGLGNRARLKEVLADVTAALPTRERHSLVALLFIDLDRFKAINDGLGHDMGDQFLREIGDRIRSTGDTHSVACRLGGDEFVLVTRLASEQQAQLLGKRVLTAITAPLWLAGRLLQPSASIGVVVGDASATGDELLTKADQAMYEAKKRGKNRVEGFHSSLDDTRSRFILEAALRQALEERSMQVHLQPIRGLAGAAGDGFEALARWEHPDLGFIPPSTFIPLAEESGLILELGRQVLTAALESVAILNQQATRPAWVSVNLSAVQFGDPDLLRFILASLASAGMDASMLHLEITESVLLSGTERLRETLAEMQRHGIHIALDDFGTGFSSLSYLLNFPNDEIKIDREFICGLDRDPRRAELVRTVLQLGASLGKQVIAEGVETEEELKLLKQMGCVYVQGYLVGRPVLVSELASQISPRSEVIFGDLLRMSPPVQSPSLLLQ